MLSIEKDFSLYLGVRILIEKKVLEYSRSDASNRTANYDFQSVGFFAISVCVPFSLGYWNIKMMIFDLDR